MIPRYTRPEMASIWEPQTRFKIWFEIEAHAADAQAELGVIPKEAAKTIWAKARNATFDVARIDEIERETKHDVIAFLTHLAEIVGPEARFVHQGMTSSDVLDTCLNVQLTRAADILISDIDKVLAAQVYQGAGHRVGAHEVRVAVGAQHEEGRGRSPSGRVDQQLHGGAVRPVQVVEDKHDGILRGDRGQERGDRLEEPVALALLAGA